MAEYDKDFLNTVRTSQDEKFLLETYDKHGDDEDIAWSLVKNHDAPVELLRKLATCGFTEVEEAVVENAKADGTVFKILSQSDKVEVLEAYLNYVGGDASVENERDAELLYYAPNVVEKLYYTADSERSETLLEHFLLPESFIIKMWNNENVPMVEKVSLTWHPNFPTEEAVKLLPMYARLEWGQSSQILEKIFRETTSWEQAETYVATMKEAFLDEKKKQASEESETNNDGDALQHNEEDFLNEFNSYISYFMLFSPHVTAEQIRKIILNGTMTYYSLDKIDKHPMVIAAAHPNTPDDVLEHIISLPPLTFDNPDKQETYDRFDKEALETNIVMRTLERETLPYSLITTPDFLTKLHTYKNIERFLETLTTHPEFKRKDLTKSIFSDVKENLIEYLLTNQLNMPLTEEEKIYIRLKYGKV